MTTPVKVIHTDDGCKEDPTLLAIGTYLARRGFKNIELVCENFGQTLSVNAIDQAVVVNDEIFMPAVVFYRGGTIVVCECIQCGEQQEISACNPELFEGTETFTRKHFVNCYHEYRRKRRAK